MTTDPDCIPPVPTEEGGELTLNQRARRIKNEAWSNYCNERLPGDPTKAKNFQASKEDVFLAGVIAGLSALPTQAPQDVAPCRVHWNRPLQTNETLQTHGHSPRSVRVLGEAPGGALDRVLIAIDGGGNPNHPAGEYAAHKRSGQVRGNLAVINVPTQAQDVAGLVEAVRAEMAGVREPDRRGALLVRCLSALRTSPISHESKALELAAADNNHQPDLSGLIATARDAVDLGRALRGSKLDDEAPARITLSDGSILTGEVAEAFEAIGDAVIELGDRAAQALAAFQSRQEGKQP